MFKSLLKFLLEYDLFDKKKDESNKVLEYINTSLLENSINEKNTEIRNYLNYDNLIIPLES